MLITLRPNDAALNRKAFLADEVRYNLLHLIMEIPDARAYRSPDGALLFAQSPGHNGWLWIDPATGADVREDLCEALVERLAGEELPGVNGDPETVRSFAAVYAARNKLAYREQMTLIPYQCALVQQIDAVGERRLAVPADRRLVADWLAGFSADAYGVTVHPYTQLPSADRLIEGGGLYFWLAEAGRPVSMANIAHRSPRHGRINAVYTPLDARKRGYASALTASLGRDLEREGRTPMLYADRDNPDSNNVYRKVGFTAEKPIAELRFYTSARASH